MDDFEYLAPIHMVMCINNLYHEKLEDKLLISIYSKYITAYGDQQSSLEGFKFNSTDGSLYEGTALEALNNPIATLANVDARYIRNLEKKGYIAKESNSTPWTYSLTDDGFIKAKELISPYKHFCIVHWKFIVATTLTFIGAITAVVRYMQCT